MQADQVTKGQPWKKYKVIKQLGAGGFGCVYLVEKKGKLFALKSIEKKHFFRNSRLQEYFKQQKQTMRSIKSPHVVKLIDEWVTQTNYEIVIEYCNEGTIQNYLASFKQYPIKKIPYYFAQILVGMYEMHKHAIIHRDLKLDNILVHDGIVKIADFGVAKRVPTIAKSNLGTIGTKAPQIYFQQDYTTKVDIWALGIILYQLYHFIPTTKKMKWPFDVKDITQKQYYVTRIQKKPIFEGTPASARDLIRKMLTKKQQQRINWLQIHQHAYLKQLIEQIGDGQTQQQLLQDLLDAKLFYQMNQIQLQRVTTIKTKVQLLYRNIFLPFSSEPSEKLQHFSLLLFQFLLSFKILELFMEVKEIRKSYPQITQSVLGYQQYLELKSIHQDLFFQLNLIMLKNGQKKLNKHDQIYSEQFFRKLAYKIQSKIIKDFSFGGQIWLSIHQYIEKSM